jgi:citronellyl-CoA synthetase
MVEIPKPKDPDLIDKKEYRKRKMAFFKKHGPLVQELFDLAIANEVSWGTIIENNAKRYSDNIAIKFEDIKLTYKEFNDSVNQYAHYFISLGLKKGDVVEIMMSNRIELLIIFTAIAKIGAISSIINIDLHGDALIYCLNKAPGKFIIIGSELIDIFINVKPTLNLSDDQILFFSPDRDSKHLPDGFIDISQKVKEFSSDDPPTTKNVKTNDPIAYLFTSGTTGLPKAAIIIHYRFVGSGYTFGLLMAETTPNDTVYVPLPFFHGTALAVGWPTAFAGGAALAFCRKLSISRFWEDVRKFNATVFIYIGELCRYLMNQPPTPNDKNNSIRAVIGPGLRPEIWKDFKERFDIDYIGEFYGASESAAIFANMLNFDCTMGTCASNYAIVKYDTEEEKPIRNEQGFMERVDVGGIGLLLFESKGMTEFRGYTEKEATQAKLFHNVFTEGDFWFNSGDLVKDQGCLHAQFVDRLGDTFRWKGHNISTTEVEEVLNTYDQVLLSTVYGVQIPHTDGRAGMAAIVPRSSVVDFELKALADKFI